MTVPKNDGKKMQYAGKGSDVGMRNIDQYGSKAGNGYATIIACVTL